MCGIVGVIEKSDAIEKVLGGLERLQYRGYDSAGVAYKSGGKIDFKKSKGTISKLIPKLEGEKSGVAIGHTRWATHGEVCERNAHPIFSSNKTWAIVHNGIIENYKLLQSKLALEGEVFNTETDSEVIACLLGLNNFSSNLKNVIWAAKQLAGSYAFCAIKQGSEKEIFAAKNRSPLYVYHNGSLSMVASDPICFPKGEYYKLEDGQICHLTAENIEFFNLKGEKLDLQAIFQQNYGQNAEKGLFEHYMLKEIYDTPDALLRLDENFSKIDLKKLQKLKFSSVKLIGCGSAYHSCLMGALYIKKHLKIDAEGVQASEFRYGDYIITPQTLCIFVSQSGETADTIYALEKARSKRAKTIVLTNVLHSTLASLGGLVLPISAGVEIAVASTKAYTCQVAGLYLLTLAFKGQKYFEKGLKKLQKTAKEFRNFYINMAAFASEIAQKEKVFFIGRGCDYVTALESALKLKEISYINCNAFPAGELKHGVLTLIDNKTPVIAIATDEKTYEKTMNSALEAKSRGAKLYLLSANPPKESELEYFERCLSLPKCPLDMRPLLAILPMQLLSYNVSVLRGINPDMPRNLAKSVTVE